MKDLIGYKWTVDKAIDDAVGIAPKDQELLILAAPEDRNLNNNKFNYTVSSPSGSPEIAKTLGSCTNWWCEQVIYPASGGVVRTLLRGTVEMTGPFGGNPNVRHKHHVWMIYPDFKGQFSGHVGSSDLGRLRGFELIEGIDPDPNIVRALNHDGTYHSGN